MPASGPSLAVWEVPAVLRDLRGECLFLVFLRLPQWRRVLFFFLSFTQGGKCFLSLLLSWASESSSFTELRRNGSLSLFYSAWTNSFSSLLFTQRRRLLFFPRHTSLVRGVADTSNVSNLRLQTRNTIPWSIGDYQPIGACWYEIFDARLFDTALGDSTGVRYGRESIYLPLHAGHTWRRLVPVRHSPTAN